jgi:hypothetical protein
VWGAFWFHGGVLFLTYFFFIGFSPLNPNFSIHLLLKPPPAAPGGGRPRPPE